MPPAAVRPRVTLGCTLEEAFPASGLEAGPRGGTDAAASVYDLYGDEQYVLTWQEGRGSVLLREAATGTTLLRVRGLVPKALESRAENP